MYQRTEIKAIANESEGPGEDFEFIMSVLNHQIWSHIILSHVAMGKATSYIESTTKITTLDTTEDASCTVSETSAISPR